MNESIACIIDPEIDKLAHSFESFIKLKRVSYKDAYKDLTFAQFIMRYAPQQNHSKDWAYIDNRLGSLQRRKDGYHC